MKKNKAPFIMLKMFLLFNHDITDYQKKDANQLGIRTFIPLTSVLRQTWENIPPEIRSIEDYLTPVKQWLIKNAAIGDYVLIQGDFGACWIMVNFAFQLKLRPVYSTTERKAVEVRQDDGSVQTVRQFKHVMFRQYGE